jgi:hypothetical protein
MLHERLAAKVLRNLLETVSFRSMTALRAALHARCAHLRVPADEDLVTRAIALVGSNHLAIVALTMTRAERTQAEQLRRAWGGCVHHPRCNRYESCLVRTVRRLRAYARAQR